MLTQAQIDQFHADGFLILRGMFSGQELSELQAAAQRVQEEGVANQGKDHLYREMPGKGKVYFRSERMWDRDPIFRAVTVKPALLESIGQCVGHPFLPINDSFVCKLPGGNVPIEWHQDPPYYDAKKFADTYEEPNFDVDIYLDKSTRENGCVWGIPGHHLVGTIDLKRFSQEELFTKFGAVPMIMEPGDVLFHSLSAPHGSIGNTTQSIRRIFYVHYMSKNVLANCYPGWGKKSGFTETGFSFVKEMLADRKRLGMETIEKSRVAFTPEGFVFNGNPTTPPKYWGKLIREMPEEEKARKRALEATAAV